MTTRPKHSEEVLRELGASGVALSDTWGGPGYRRYFTPSGREVYKLPAMRESIIRGDPDDPKRVTWSGERDANLGDDLLEQMPAALMLDCPHCSKWHDTEAEIATCAEQRAVREEAGEVLARRMLKENPEGTTAETEARFVALEDELGELKEGQGRIEGLLKKLVAQGA